MKCNVLRQGMTPIEFSFLAGIKTKASVIEFDCDIEDRRLYFKSGSVTASFCTAQVEHVSDHRPFSTPTKTYKIPLDFLTSNIGLVDFQSLGISGLVGDLSCTDGFITFLSSDSYRIVSYTSFNDSVSDFSFSFPLAFLRKSLAKKNDLFDDILTVGISSNMLQFETGAVVVYHPALVTDMQEAKDFMSDVFSSKRTGAIEALFSFDVAEALDVIAEISSICKLDDDLNFEIELSRKGKAKIHASAKTVESSGFFKIDLLQSDETKFVDDAIKFIIKSTIFNEILSNVKSSFAKINFLLSTNYIALFVETKRRSYYSIFSRVNDT